MPESVATESLIRQALKEDLANQTDITTTLTVPDYKTATAVICTRIEGTLAGVLIIGILSNILGLHGVQKDFQLKSLCQIGNH